MNVIASLLLDLFILFAAAKIAGEIFERLRQPAVIGELLVGVVIGPFALGWVGGVNAPLVELFHGDQAAAKEAVHLVHHLIAELGVVVLLFFVGLETRVSDLLRVGVRATLVGVMGISLPFILGLLYVVWLGHPQIEALFVATALVATSVGITARVLRDLGHVTSIEARIILGAAVIDDILAMVILAVVSGLASAGGLNPLGIGLIIAQAVGFVAFLLIVGTRLSRRYSLHLERLRMPDGPFAVAMLLMLGIAALAGSIGLAAIIGAFLAGMVLAEAREHFDLEHQTLPVYQFLVPFFFVITGTQVDWRVFLDPNVVGIAAVVTLLAIVGKVVGCGLAATGMGWKSMAILGIGMTPRGEVGLIVASLGRSLGIIPPEIFSVIVIMSVVTTLVVPPVLRLLFASRPRSDAPQETAEAIPVPEPIRAARTEQPMGQSGHLPEL